MRSDVTPRRPEMSFASRNGRFEACAGRACEAGRSPRSRCWPRPCCPVAAERSLPRRPAWTATSRPASASSCASAHPATTPTATAKRLWPGTSPTRTCSTASGGPTAARAIYKPIRQGRDPMPKFQGKLTDEEIRQTVAYVLALDRSAQAQRDAHRAVTAARRAAMIRRLPLFPLPGVVLLPETLLPLHIFEPRYRTLVADALAGDRTIGMAMWRPDGPAPGNARPPPRRRGRRDRRVRGARGRPVQHRAAGALSLPRGREAAVGVLSRRAGRGDPLDPVSDPRATRALSGGMALQRPCRPPRSPAVPGRTCARAARLRDRPALRYTPEELQAILETELSGAVGDASGEWPSGRRASTFSRRFARASWICGGMGYSSCDRLRVAFLRRRGRPQMSAGGGQDLGVDAFSARSCAQLLMALIWSSIVTDSGTVRGDHLVEVVLGQRAGLRVGVDHAG